MTTLRQYKALPRIEDLNPGIEPGWRFGVVLLQAEAEEKTRGGIILADETRGDERAAAVEALLVAVSPTAFKHSDWEATGLPRPYNPGDHVFTQRYPAGVRVIGDDGREYLLCKDEVIDGKRNTPKLEAAKAA